MYLDLSLNMLDTSSFHIPKKKLLNSRSNGIYISDSYGNPFYRLYFQIYILYIISDILYRICDI